MSRSPVERFRDNLTGIVSTVVTGVWLAALFTGQDWWLAVLLFGYIVVVPVVAILFGDDEDVEEWWDDEGRWDDESSAADPIGTRADESVQSTGASTADSDTGDALDVLRDRYARGDLTDEQFERKLERLLESESLEDVEDRRTRQRERESERGR